MALTLFIIFCLSFSTFHAMFDFLGSDFFTAQSWHARFVGIFSPRGLLLPQFLFQDLEQLKNLVFPCAFFQVIGSTPSLFPFSLSQKISVSV